MIEVSFQLNNGAAPEFFLMIWTSNEKRQWEGQ
jgi:hypothetical protein